MVAVDGPAITSRGQVAETIVRSTFGVLSVKNELRIAS